MFIFSFAKHTFQTTKSKSHIYRTYNQVWYTFKTESNQNLRCKTDYERYTSTSKVSSVTKIYIRKKLSLFPN